MTFDGIGKLTVAVVAGVSAFGNLTTLTSFSVSNTVNADLYRHHCPEVLRHLSQPRGICDGRRA
jgi:hypothetical protein